MFFPLLPLLLLFPARGEACEAQVQELRREMNEKYAEMEVRLMQKEAEMEAKIMKKDAEIKDLTNQVDGVAEALPRAVSSALRDLPYLLLCSFQNHWITPSSTITYSSFLTNFNNANRPGGADGQLDLDSGVFTCLTPGTLDPAHFR